MNKGKGRNRHFGFSKEDWCTWILFSLFFSTLILSFSFLYGHLTVHLIMTFGDLNINRTPCIPITMHGISLFTKPLLHVSYWNRAGPYGLCPSRPPLAFGLWKNFGQRIRLIREVRTCRWVGGGIGMGNTCKSMADSCQCMAKTTTIL